MVETTKGRLQDEASGCFPERLTAARSRRYPIAGKVIVERRGRREGYREREG
jgi:hypothetical protein